MSTLKVPTVAEMVARNEQPDILFWVGCSGVLMIELKNYQGHCQNFELL
ncbi:MAG: hypothetical protein CM15mP65_26260 [Crocinitomicaceae bacterium]|nr:MAG: hypothetical protein CM15mP65_26260 [Crocinitomicaceae bacterium]